MTKNLIYITLPTLVISFLCLEFFFHYFLPACERPNLDWNEKYDLLQHDSIPKQSVYTIGKLAKQRGRWRINNHNWNSPINYRQPAGQPSIAVIGDSYVEAFQVDVDKSFFSILRDSLPFYNIYSFGISGTPLSHYLHLARYVSTEFNPDTYIFNMVHNDFDESLLERHPNKSHFLTLGIEADSIREIYPQKPRLEGFKRKLKLFFKKSALVRYLYINLQASAIKNRLVEDQQFFQNNLNYQKLLNAESDIIKIVPYIFQKLKEELTEKRIIFLLDAPRYNIYADNLEDAPVQFLHRLMDENCKKYDFEFIDLTTTFYTNYQKNQIPFNSDIDGHWNEYGHRLVCDTLFKYLRSRPPLSIAD